MGEFGELLRNARAYRGVSLLDAERATRINRRYLAALEQEAFDQLPPLTYARGIVRNYAQYLGLDPVTVLALFEEAHGQRSVGFRVVPATRPVREPVFHWAPNFAVIAFMLALSAVVFALVYATYFAPRESSGSAPTLTVGPNTPRPTVSVDTPPPTPTPVDQPVTAIASPPALSAPRPTTPSVGTNRPTPTPIPPTPTTAPTEHLFEIVAIGRVWVQATVDGQTVLAEVLDAGERHTFRGQSLVVTSGNAPLVRIVVDEEDRGLLGQRWDATGTYP